MQKYYNSPEVELLYSVKIVSTYLSLSQLFCISLFVRFFNLKKSNGKMVKITYLILDRFVN